MIFIILIKTTTEKLNSFFTLVSSPPLFTKNLFPSRTITPGACKVPAISKWLGFCQCAKSQFSLKRAKYFGFGPNVLKMDQEGLKRNQEGIKNVLSKKVLKSSWLWSLRKCSATVLVVIVQPGLDPPLSFYRTRVRSLAVLVTNWLTDSLTDSLTAV